MRKKLKSVLVAWQNEKWSSFHLLLTFSFFTNMAGFEYSTVVEQFMNGCGTEKCIRDIYGFKVYLLLFMSVVWVSDICGTKTSDF